MVTSASITIANRDSGDPFAFLERQLILVVMGLGAASLVFLVPIARLEQLATPLLLVAVLLLLLVLIPGLGHVVNGSRRWLRLAGFNFQVSEAARVLTLIYLASYCVRFENALRSGLAGLARPRSIGGDGAVAVARPDFGALRRCSSPASAPHRAGAQLRWAGRGAAGARRRGGGR
jgi:cell division protein FtsW